MKVIDLKKPRTGRVIYKTAVSYLIDWHYDDEPEFLYPKDLRELWHGKKRYKFI